MNTIKSEMPETLPINRETKQKSKTYHYLVSHCKATHFLAVFRQFKFEKFVINIFIQIDAFLSHFS